MVAFLLVLLLDWYLSNTHCASVLLLVIAVLAVIGTFLLWRKTIKNGLAL